MSRLLGLLRTAQHGPDPVGEPDMGGSDHPTAEKSDTQGEYPEHHDLFIVPGTHRLNIQN